MYQTTIKYFALLGRLDLALRIFYADCRLGWNLNHVTYAASTQTEFCYTGAIR